MMLRSFSQVAVLTSAKPQVADDIDRVWGALSCLEMTYPGFGVWFHTRVVQGLEAGTRRFFVSSRGDRLSAVVIAKRDDLERKLCTVWVDPDHRGSGLATRLIDEASDWLEETHPLLTVPQERIAEFLPLVRSRDFALTQALPSYYRGDAIEYVFNGRLRPRRVG